MLSYFIGARSLDTLYNGISGREAQISWVILSPQQMSAIEARCGEHKLDGTIMPESAVASILRQEFLICRHL
jgi:hypothetical protein